jgi:hypothetical protein|mmetsp:Transcript_17332/g.26821  ORF Transcript_17332/g.26821 Transcript_17332/m.26821 type:complete len:531 (-) Transcript_17332:161-1753(-)|eukprot:CAMPEP_0195280958 /NCGR_PEP_ID=MMETSP0707-20130614/460_1 /TAXON_ID=33640 /ORGANISM="Asterionellopsis glacialis, Strain CCMP134" /LENGTH=530 /DNA_ID=CAMNT_0040339793 /DNA_START=85 /DNA_END=1677 /DNA_ORIENTATION=+
MKLSLALSILLAAPAAQAFSTNGGAFVRSTRAVAARPLFGIMDEVNSDAFDLLSSVAKSAGDTQKAQQEGGISPQLEAAYEQFLGELVFSANDPRMDIINNIDRCGDQEWLDWLQSKGENSKDPEERIALKDLYEMITDVQKKMELSRMAEERAAKEAEEAEAARLAAAEADADAGRKLSGADILKKAGAIDAAAGFDGVVQEEKEKVNFYESELTPEIRLSYEDTLKKVLPPYAAGESTASVVFNYYDQFDAQFVKVLTERAANGDDDSSALLEALAVEQQNRLTAATESLKSVLAQGEPGRMMGAVVKLAREGKVDEAFLLLLEANATQARDAGAHGPAELMDQLRKRAIEEKDKQASSKEIVLIRKLLREDSAAEREKILEDAFTPREQFLVAGTPENAQRALDGEVPEEQKPMPDVPPPDFVNACKAVMLNFGNLETDDERGDLATRIKTIASEAEVVATRIFGKGMTLREQQDRAWKEQTTSIFDLETMEINAERMGESAPWTNPDADDDIIPGFDASGKMKIGG